ncbi:hypothetical protein [Lacticaseibacillus sp. GG6-2]
MYDYGQMISQLGLIGLLPQTQAKLTLRLAATDAVLPASPYWHQTKAALDVTLPWDENLRTSTRMLAAVTTTLVRAGVDVTLQETPFTLDWALPEKLFERAYMAVQDSKDAPSYIAFRNGWYVRFVQVWPKFQAQLQAQFGVTHGFDLRLLGDDPDHKGILGMRWENVPIMANTDTGNQTQNLVWLRAAIWGVLANTMPAELNSWVQAQVLDEETLSVCARFTVGKRRQIQAPDDGLHLPGYPQLSLDSQLLVATALAAGRKVEVLNETAEVLRIDGRLIVGSAALNSQVAVATSRVRPAVKRLLGEAGLPTPGGAVYLTLRAALHDYHTSFTNKAIALKPTQGQDGDGVHVFMLPPTEKVFIAAFNDAAQYGPVLIEAYAKGAAYRLVVQDDQMIAALELTPANVVGDGRKSVAALVSHKNARRPLGWQPVVLDSVAENLLAAQGVSTDTIVPRGHQVFLRNESNTRFGSDGYDVTDDLAIGYADLAVQAVKAIGLRRAGVDMVIANLYADYDPQHSGQAAILGVTATPALWPHAVAQMGTKRNLATSLLAALLA